MPCVARLNGDTAMDILAKLRADREKHEKILAGIRDAISAGEELTEEQEQSYSESIDAIDSIDARIERLERIEGAMDRGLDRFGRKTDPNDEVRASDIKVGYSRASYDPWLGYRNAAEFCRDIRAVCSPPGSEFGTPSPKLAESARLMAEWNRREYGIEDAPSGFQREAIGTDGGYETLPAMREEIWTIFESAGGLINRFDIQDTNANTVEFRRDETTPWGSLGVQANWASEGSQFTNSKLQTEPGQIRLHKLYAFVLATEELLADAPRIEDRITRQAARALNWAASDAIIYGTGAGQPLGIFNAPALISVAKESGQAADTIQIENIVKMRERLLPESFDGSFWLANPDTLNQIYTLQIANQPVWTQPGTGARDEPGGMLLGLPIVFSQHAKTLGDKGDIFLISPSAYFLYAKRGGTNFASSIHLYFDYDIQAFRWTMRIGGQPALSAPVSPANGSNTMSNFVVLDARA